MVFPQAAGDQPLNGLDFLSGGGEMGALIRNYDWAGHPLGPPDRWPRSLKTAVSLILSSQHPMWIGWGREMSFLYDDAYLHVLGLAKHPWALGRPASEVWAEIWDVCGPLAEKVFREGQASFVDDVRLFMSRGDFLEETYYSFSYSPIRDEAGRVGGLFCPSNDVTPKVIGARRLRTLSELATQALVEKSTQAACASAAATLSKNPDDVPFALLYLVEPGGAHARLEQCVGVKPGGPLSPAVVEIAAEASPRVMWPAAAVLESGVPRRAPLEEYAGLARGAADQPVSEAILLPVSAGGQESPAGVFIAGVNPTRKLEADYQTFFELVAGHIGTAIQSARAAEDTKKRADMLAEIDRAKTVFFSNVSHEFRTPLTLLLSPLEEIIAKPEGGLPPQHRQMLEVAHRNAMRLQKLVNTLLDFSRIEAGRAQACYEAVDLAALTADLASTFRSACEKAGLELIIDCPPGGEPVYVDRDMWEKIVLNLVSNAFKYTLAGSIRVSLHSADGRAVLSVEDTGTGIPETELPRIFERFHRVENARGRTQEGTGIGLALVQELTRLHGGSVKVRSVPGQGSAFSVEIPMGKAHLPADRIGGARTLAPASVGAGAYVQEALRWLPDAPRANGDSGVLLSMDAGGAGRGYEGSRARILLADDNADMREYIRRLLGQDYDVICAADGLAALAAARERAPDLVLTDVMMPGLDGFALLGELRASQATRETPVIMLSARAGEEARIEGLEAGADDYITKPFSAKELTARVEGLLKLHKARREGREEVERYARRLQTALSAARMAAWEWDLRSGRVIYSANAREVTGQLADEPMAPAWANIHPEDAPKLRAITDKALARRGDYVAEVRWIRPDTGEERWVRIHGSVAPGAAGDPESVTGVILDITDRKQAEEEIRTNMDELTRFNRVAVGRELRIIELKSEVNDLCRRLGYPVRYPLAFEEEANVSEVSGMALSEKEPNGGPAK
jgi:PAS domain S-box-containing protein